MSWSAYTAALSDQVHDRLAALQPFGDSFPARDDQVKVAKEAIQVIIDSGAVGKGEGFGITISGHANENHEPQSGYANDTVSVTVSQLSASAVETYDQQQAAAQKNLE